MNKPVFYDTCSLLLAQKQAFKEHFYISMVTIGELENLKTSKDREDSIKSAARAVIRLLDENPNAYEVVFLEQELPRKTNDEIIILSYIAKRITVPDLVFCTNDISCKLVAQYLYGIDRNDIFAYAELETYKGYKVINNLSDEELAFFYEHSKTNTYRLFENEYLYLPQTKETYVWRSGEYTKVFPTTFKSQLFGSVTALKDDPQQIMAMDSLKHNKLTLLRGKAGSGKSYLALGALFSMLDHGDIDKIIIFCNTVAVAGAARLGFYPGTRTEKLLDSQIGNFLSSKLGDRCEVERLIKEGKIELLPLADIRGFDTTGLNAGIYITEAQNLDRNLMKLALQRIGEDCICILDGDDMSQVDLPQYAGNNNGIKAVLRAYKGESLFGTVKLERIHRSRIAELADRI